MVASPKLPDHARFRKPSESVQPEQQPSLPTQPPTLRAGRNGTVCLWGYGVKVFVRNGHLQLHDGVGRDRHTWRFARVGSGLKRLVVISDSGFISLDALRWIFDKQNTAFIMLDRDGAVIASSGPAYGLDDARLRRAQGQALRTGVGLEIARELIVRKLSGQEKVARESLKNLATAEAIARFRKSLAAAKTIAAVSLIEAYSAAEYWKTWERVPITFSQSDVRAGRVPDHWCVFGRRRSAISGSQRLAADPLNCLINFEYGLLRSEARLAVSAVGLDPGLGFIHLDTKARASLADDVMEVVRPQADDWILKWIGRAGLRREWFIEMPNGNCRLSRSLAAELAKTAPLWRAAVAPIAEWVARTLWASMKKGENEAAPATRLTQTRKREVKGGYTAPAVRVPRPAGVCRFCGKPVPPDSGCCAACAPKAAAERLSKAGVAGRIAAHTPAVHARISATHRRVAAAKANWDPASQPAWLTEQTYETRIQPALANIATSAISTALGVSWVYAKEIRIGKSRPHPRHFVKLAELVGISADV